MWLPPMSACVPRNSGIEKATLMNVHGASDGRLGCNQTPTALQGDQTPSSRRRRRRRRPVEPTAAAVLVVVGTRHGMKRPHCAVGLAQYGLPISPGLNWIRLSSALHEPTNISGFPSPVMSDEALVLSAHVSRYLELLLASYRCRYSWDSDTNYQSQTRMPAIGSARKHRAPCRTPADLDDGRPNRRR